MNIFVLDENPKIAAQMHCDKHCSKMIVEHAQMLAAAYYHTLGISKKKEIPEKQKAVNIIFKGWPRKNEDGTEHHYSLTHVNHPCTIWTRESIQNFNWLIECTDELCESFKLRYNHYPSIKLIIEWMKTNPPRLSNKGLTPFAKAMPDCFIKHNAIESYRRYYAMKTSYMKVEWRYTDKPYWFTDSFINENIEIYNIFKNQELLIK